jgi:hypothetical protein
LTYGDDTNVTVNATFDDVSTIVVQADITGHEERYNLVTECLEAVQYAYEAAQQEPPTKLLVMTWEKVLNDTWARVLL